jgi:hypothetical protein
MENKDKLAEVIDFNKAKKRIVLKKSALRELHEKMFPCTSARILFIRLRPKSAGCPGCKNVSLCFGRFSISCRVCPWYGVRKGECPHCRGDVVNVKGEIFCIQCLTKFGPEILPFVLPPSRNTQLLKSP